MTLFYELQHSSCMRRHAVFSLERLSSKVLRQLVAEGNSNHSSINHLWFYSASSAASEILQGRPVKSDGASPGMCASSCCPQRVRYCLHCVTTSQIAGGTQALAVNLESSPLQQSQAPPSPISQQQRQLKPTPSSPMAIQTVEAPLNFPPPAAATESPKKQLAIQTAPAASQEGPQAELSVGDYASLGKVSSSMGKSPLCRLQA